MPRLFTLPVAQFQFRHYRRLYYDTVERERRHREELTEHYNQLVPQGKDGERLGFEVTSGGQSGQPTLIDTAGLVSNDVLPLGLFEWQVELWRVRSEAIAPYIPVLPA